MKNTERYKRSILPKCHCGQDEAEYAWDWANRLEDALLECRELSKIANGNEDVEILIDDLFKDNQ